MNDISAYIFIIFVMGAWLLTGCLQSVSLTGSCSNTRCTEPVCTCRSLAEIVEGLAKTDRGPKYARSARSVVGDSIPLYFERCE